MQIEETMYTIYTIRETRKKNVRCSQVLCLHDLTRSNNKISAGGASIHLKLKMHQNTAEMLDWCPRRITHSACLARGVQHSGIPLDISSNATLQTVKHSVSLGVHLFLT